MKNFGFFGGISKFVSESFVDSNINEDPDIDVQNSIDDAEETYEKVPDEFVEYKYQDKLNDLRKDVDYFKGRLDSSESDEAKDKYRKLISDLLDQEKKLMFVTDIKDKHELDKNQYVADRIADDLDA